jgi:carboxylesterase type B
LRPSWIECVTDLAELSRRNQLQSIPAPDEKWCTGGGSEARDLGGRMSDAWIAFARKGNPNHSGLSNWPAFTAKEGALMVFDNKCESE